MKKWLRALMSVAAAAFGVQSNKNREHDFANLPAGVVIAAGLIFTVLFVLTLAAIVSWVLP